MTSKMVSILAGIVSLFVLLGGFYTIVESITELKIEVRNTTKAVKEQDKLLRAFEDRQTLIKSNTEHLEEVLAALLKDSVKVAYVNGKFVVLEVNDNQIRVAKYIDMDDNVSVYEEDKEVTMSDILEGEF